tara:strand:- start:179 stop:754 length:576 start_codon:yes stop_codon:yes gene_type:complete
LQRLTNSATLWDKREEGNDGEPRVIRNLEELAELQKCGMKGKEGVYQMDASLLEAWTEAGGDMPLDAAVGKESEGLEEETGTSYEKQRLENDVAVQADLDLQKVEEARSMMFQRLLGSDPFDTHEAPLDGGQDGVNMDSPRSDNDAKQKPSQEQVDRKQQLMREIAEGMKLNLAKERKQEKEGGGRTSRLQ